MIEKLLVTGATGLVGSHVVERACREGIPVRALVRANAETRTLSQWPVELVTGDLSEPDRLAGAVEGVSHVVHAAAKVGDWGPIDDFRAVNVRSLAHLIEACQRAGSVRRFVHISSLGVYEPRDHFGTDETTPPSASGLDGYTLSKIEAEAHLLAEVREHGFPAVVLRPGFIYGPRDRTVLPRLLDRLKKGQVRYFGSGDQLLNQTYVINLTEAIFRALNVDGVLGEVFNVTDGHLVSKRAFIETAARYAGLPAPKRKIPRSVARWLARISEAVYRTLGKTEAPLVSMARYKFLGLNLDFSIDKARRLLGYNPPVPFDEAMAATIAWFESEGIVGKRLTSH